MEEAYFKADDEFFKIPCSYFSGKCTIYHLPKARVCSKFKCKLLVRFIKEKIATQDALEIIKNAKKYRSEIENIAYENLNIPKGTPLKMLELKVAELKNNAESLSIINQTGDLVVKCLILEVLLIKLFSFKRKF